MRTPGSPAAAGADLESHRRLLWGLAYRLTGSAADADDVVQETFLRTLGRVLPPGEEDLRRWLVRVATNLGLDVLRRRRRSYPGPWLPAPVEREPDDPPAGPEARYERLESLSFAFLIALEALTPRQRAVLLFRDVLGYSAAETAEVLGLGEGNVRIVHLRARRAMSAYDRGRRVPDRRLRARMREALAGLADCLARQDVAGLERLLAESACTITDGGGEYHALRAPLRGRERVMRFHLRVAARRGPRSRIEPCTVNGLPALKIRFGDRRPGAAPCAVLRCELDGDGRIREIHSILASRKLAAVRFAP